MNIFKKKSPVCPYCGITLNPPPKRKSECPGCGKIIRVSKGKLITEEEYSIQKWLVDLSAFNVDRACFEKNRKELSKQFGFTAPVNDTVWKILNKLVVKREYTKFAYYTMAKLVRMEGKSDKQYLSLALEFELREWKSMGSKKVKIVGCGGRNDDPHACQGCKALYNKVYDIDVALKTMPVPNACTNKELGCRCSYKPV